MPENHKQRFSYTLRLIQFILFIAFISPTYAVGGIETYYIRYDVKSSRNKITDDNLLMVPAKNDFRAENFSQTSTSGAISAALGESKISIEKRIRENALKTILVNKGLKSVKAKDHDTVISYEGIILHPLNLIKNTYHKEQNNYVYEIQIKFSPVAFPDKWETLGRKNRIKELLYDFFQLFK